MKRPHRLARWILPPLLIIGAAAPIAYQLFFRTPEKRVLAIWKDIDCAASGQNWNALKLLLTDRSARAVERLQHLQATPTTLTERHLAFDHLALAAPAAESVTAASQLAQKSKLEAVPRIKDENTVLLDVTDGTNGTWTMVFTKESDEWKLDLLATLAYQRP